MPTITLTLNADCAWTDLPKDKIRRADDDVPMRVALLRGGMQSGKHAVLFAIKLEDGTWVWAQTSLALFLGAADAFRARVQADLESN